MRAANVILFIMCCAMNDYGFSFDECATNILNILTVLANICYGILQRFTFQHIWMNATKNDETY